MPKSSRTQSVPARTLLIRPSTSNTVKHRSCSFSTGVLQVVNDQSSTRHVANNWFHSKYVPKMLEVCLSSVSLSKATKELTLFWNKCNSSSSKVTRADTEQILVEVLKANAQTAFPLKLPSSLYKRSIAMRGGALNCMASTNYAPSNFDSYDRTRSPYGSSSIAGATIPVSPFQKLSNWFYGKNVIFTPGKTDSTFQNQGQYLSPTAGSPIGLPLDTPVTASYPVTTSTSGAPLTANYFNEPVVSSTLGTYSTLGVTPKFRSVGGGHSKKKNAKRTVKRAAKRAVKRTGKSTVQGKGNGTGKGKGKGKTKTKSKSSAQ